MCLGYYVEKWISKLLKKNSKAKTIATIANYTTQGVAYALVAAVAAGLSAASVGALAAPFAAALSSPVGMAIITAAVSL